jgi:hypothetical protein
MAPPDALEAPKNMKDINGGWGGIRTHGPSRDGGFQDRYHKPLGHPSVDRFIIAFHQHTVKMRLTFEADVNII